MAAIDPRTPDALFRYHLLLDMLKAGSSDPVELAERALAFITGAANTNAPPPVEIVPVPAEPVGAIEPPTVPVIYDRPAVAGPEAPAGIDPEAEWAAIEETLATEEEPPDFPAPARDVPPGETWAFLGHRSCEEASSPTVADRLPAIARGEATVTDLIANHPEELLRWWLAGKTLADMAGHFGASKPTVARALKTAGFSEAFRRGPAGKTAYDLVPLGEELPPLAREVLARRPLADPPPPVEIKADDDRVAAALEADKPGFPLQTRTPAEVEWSQPEPPPAPQRQPSAPRPGQPPTGRNWLSNKPREQPEEKAAERALIAAAIDTGLAKINRVPGPGGHPGGPVEIDVVIGYLRWGDDEVVPIGKGMWLVNGGESLSAKALLEKANKRRKRQRVAPFELAG